MQISFDQKPSSPNEQNGLNVSYAPSRRPFSKWRFRIVLFLFLLPFALYVGYLIYHAVVVIEPGFIMLKELKIKSGAEGVITYLKEPGSFVKKGELIATLKNPYLQAEYKNYKKKYEYNKKNIMSTIKHNQEALKIAKDNYNIKLSEYYRLKRLQEEGHVTQLDVSNAMIQLESARLNYSNAKQNLENSKMALKDVLADQLKLLEIKEKLKALKIYAQKDGIVVTLEAKEGELVNKFDTILTIDLHTKPVIEMFLSPNHAKYAKVGEHVVVIFPDKTKIDATISKIQMQAVKTPFRISSLFEKNPYSIVLELQLQKKLPKRFLINYLPIKVRFDPFYKEYF